MKPLVWALTIMVALAALIAVPWLALRTQRGVECPDRVVIMRGRGAKPFECVCIDGVLATCFEPGP